MVTYPTGLVIAVIKGYTPEGTLKKAYEKEKVVIIT